MDNYNCCVIIPTLNEQESIFDLVSFFVSNKFFVIVIDDNSSDETRQLATYAGAYVIHNQARKGLAKSLWQGFSLALEHDAEYIATVDAGKSHNPKDLLEMLKLMPDNDLVIGSRFLKNSFYDNTKGKFLRPYASKFAALLCNLAQHGTGYSDWSSGYRIYRANLIQALKKFIYNSTMHPVQIELLGRATSLGAKISEYPITYIACKTSFNKKTISEAFKIWLQIINHYSPRPKFIESELF